MAQLPKVFDQEVKETEFSALPEGWYVADITNAEIKESKSGGHYINIRYDVTGPTHQGRVVFGMITVNHNNPKAVEIGEAQINKLRSACGIGALTDTDQLIGKKVQIKLKTEKSDEYGDQNRITAWKAVEGGVPPMPKQEQKQTETPEGYVAPNSTTPPWA